MAEFVDLIKSLPDGPIKWSRGWEDIYSSQPGSSLTTTSSTSKIIKMKRGSTQQGLTVYITAVIIRLHVLFYNKKNSGEKFEDCDQGNQPSFSWWFECQFKSHHSVVTMVICQQSPPLQITWSLPPSPRKLVSSNLWLIGHLAASVSGKAAGGGISSCQTRCAALRRKERYTEYLPIHRQNNLISRNIFCQLN